MASTVAWLDSTAEEQRIARELIALFTQQESRDELGIGQVRDAFSDLLFPGTSVLLTRARYFLFVPWCYSQARARGTSGERCKARGDAQERKLIMSLREAQLEDAAGLIGVRVGAGVKTLPSAIYWNALRRYTILTHDADTSHLGLLDAPPDEAATELAERRRGDWDAGLPDPPDGFPDAIPSGFQLSQEEAGWLAGRVSVSVPDSVLHHLVERRGHLADTANFAWDVVEEAQFEALVHARRFSTVMHGASLLYNLLVAERYASQPELTRLGDLRDHYRFALDEWNEYAIGPLAQDLGQWDVERMWQTVRVANPRVQPTTRLFVDAWISATRRGSTAGAADDKKLRRLVRQREGRKGKQSRLINDKLLANWSGASGAGQLDFRWGTVRGLVNDIVTGLEPNAAA
ncbi:MAG: DUF6361 family protein [Humibacillus sp.]|nr:DUF6361 family protein [Humibacillus sp.]MDN5776605.1 DUF6361 family protein [Humibacillus sp.]